MLPLQLFGQHIQGHQLESNNQSGLGSGEVFSPFKKNQKDSTKVELDVPKEIRQWHVNEKTGEVMPVNADTLQHMFQNWHLTEGVNGEYNFLGNMGTPRQTRIFFNRPTDTSYDFMQPYDYFYTRPGEFYFTDTKSPYTNLSYHSSGNKINGDDRFRAYFTTNAGKHFGVGFLFDYLYARGRYDNQASSQMNFSLFSFYRSNRYNYHLLASRYHMKQAENGGITDDRYITRPEETDGSNSNFGTSDIPVKLEDSWNRNEVYTLFFTHNYNIGFNREKMVNAVTADSTQTQFKDSTVNEFVTVSRITHTLDITQNSREFINYRQPAHVMSAHRTPEAAAKFAASAAQNGFGVIIAAAGMAAHLAGVITGHTTLPVIGIPIKSATFDGLDALLATVQMPSGIPVATVAVNGAENAAILAAQMLAIHDQELAETLLQAKQDMIVKVQEKDKKIMAEVEAL